MIFSFAAVFKPAAAVQISSPILIIHKTSGNFSQQKKFMLATTIKIVRSGLESDPSLTPADRTRLMAVLRNGVTPRKPDSPPPDNPPRLLRRAEVARRLSCSLRTVDKLPIKKVKLPGRQRASGFLEGDVNALILAGDQHGGIV